MIKTQVSKLTLLTNNEILLQDFSKSFEEGKIYAIIGSNGSGKTTLLNLLAGSLDIRFFNFEGETLFNGVKFSSLNQKDEQKFRNSNLRYVFQDSINSFDPLKKLKYYFKNVDVNNKNISELFEYFQMPEYSEIKNQHIYEMSGGMAQRIQVILALLAKPNYFFLDEPTSALDFPVANRFSKRIKKFTIENKATTIIVTQDIRFALDCADEIAILSKKRLNFEHNNFDYDSIANRLAKK